jgi:hypothetical protein
MFYAYNAFTNRMTLQQEYQVGYHLEPGAGAWIYETPPSGYWYVAPYGANYGDGVVLEIPTGINYVLVRDWGGLDYVVTPMNWVWITPLTIFFLWKLQKFLVKMFYGAFGAHADNPVT